MAQSFVRVPPDSTGKLVDTWLTAGGQHRQVIVIGDHTTDANIVGISSRLKLPVELEELLDYDTGGGTRNVSLVGLALPASGGPVAGGTSTNPLRTDPTGTTTQPVSGTVTANAGTNLNTSLLALEAGGNLATLAGIVASARAAVNAIVGQAGITGGAGAVAANTPRTTLASDDPAVVALQILDNFISGSRGLVTEDNSAAIKTAVEILDNIVAGSEAQVDVITQPARVATTDSITAKLATDKLQNGLTELTPKFAVIAASASGDNTLVSAVGGKKLRVLNYVLMSNGTVNAKFQSSTAGDITGLLYLVANTGASSSFNPVGHFETVSGEALELNLSGAIAVGGHLSYVEV
jgi:hypothetical protein